jgi:uncharacterized protein
MTSMASVTLPANREIARDKESRLADWLRARGRVLLGFSGGVDSAFLAAVAVEAIGRDNVLAVIGRSASYPEEQWIAAREVADRIGLRVIELDTNELADERYSANPTNRCYFCKTELWSRLAPVAVEHGIDTIIDGTNADDEHEWRPGASAGRERGVASPLVEVGLGKAEIRLLSQMRGLPSADRPSSPCLASRIPYGTAVTVERLRAVEAAERALRSLGVRGDLRVRHHGDLARVELTAPELERFIVEPAASELVRAVRACGFARVAIDLKGFRSGSLNVLQGIVDG